MEKRDKPKTGFDRRNILKTAGTSLGALSIISTANAQSSPGVQVSSYRSQNKQIEYSEKRDLQKRAAEKHRSKQGTDESILVGGPRIVEGAKLVSYALKVYPDGQSQYYSGIVPEDPSKKSVNSVHQRTRQFQQIVDDASSPRDYVAKIMADR